MDQFIQINNFNNNLLDSGKTAKGRILSLNDTGLKITGDATFVNFSVQVTPEDLISFESNADGFVGVNNLNKYSAGTEVEVKYNSLDKSKVVIVPKP